MRPIPASFTRSCGCCPSSDGANRATDYQLQLPLERLDPGPYLLTIEVTHGNVKVRRDARFELR